MDPMATLKAARAAVKEGDYGTARERLSDYRAWRAKGGFEPLNGDETARVIAGIMRGAAWAVGELDGSRMPA